MTTVVPQAGDARRGTILPSVVVFVVILRKVASISRRVTFAGCNKQRARARAYVDSSPRLTRRYHRASVVGFGVIGSLVTPASREILGVIRRRSSAQTASAHGRESFEISKARWSTREQKRRRETSRGKRRRSLGLKVAIEIGAD